MKAKEKQTVKARVLAVYPKAFTRRTKDGFEVVNPGKDGFKSLGQSGTAAGAWSEAWRRLGQP